jgi:hypothetical protein
MLHGALLGHGDYSETSPPPPAPKGRGGKSPLPRRERVRVRSFCPLRMAHRDMEDSE